MWREKTIDEIRIAYVRKLRESAGGRSAQYGDLDLAAERARLAKEQADRVELDNAERRGELVRVEDVLIAWAGHIGTVKQALLGLPSKCAGMIAPPGKTAQAEAILRQHVKEALTELSTDGLPRKRRRTRGAGSGDVDATTGSDGEPVG